MSTSQQPGQQLARDYERRVLQGWAGTTRPDLIRGEFDLLAAGFRPFHVRGQTRPTAGRKTMLYQVCRKVLGKDTDNYAQEIGDCVSFGYKNGTEYLQCCEKLLSGKQEKWRPVFPPYYYGTGRTYIGGGQMGNEDGSSGSWMAEAIQKYGTLFADEPNVPKYSGRIAKAWGDPNPRQDLDQWQDVAKHFLIHSAALIKTWDDLCAAIVNGYPVTTASDVGYSMEASRDGFHAQTTSWSHEMCFVGVDETYTEPYAILLNSWGDAHGRLKDFQTNEDLPMGVLRVRRKDAEKHLRAGETFVVSQFDGFPEQDLDKALFLLI